MSQRIGVIGGVNMDIHLFGSNQAADGHIIADHYLAEPGGKGANQARAAARLGAGESGGPLSAEPRRGGGGTLRAGPDGSPRLIG